MSKRKVIAMGWTMKCVNLCCKSWFLGFWLESSTFCGLELLRLLLVVGMTEKTPPSIRKWTIICTYVKQTYLAKTFLDLVQWRKLIYLIFKNHKWLKNDHSVCLSLSIFFFSGIQIQNGILPKPLLQAFSWVWLPMISW